MAISMIMFSKITFKHGQKQVCKKWHFLCIYSLLELISWKVDKLMLNRPLAFQVYTISSPHKKNCFHMEISAEMINGLRKNRKKRIFIFKRLYMFKKFFFAR